MRKIVINTCYGGFSLSQKAMDVLAQKGCLIDNYRAYGERANPLVAEVVESLGEEANGKYAKLKVVEIPDGIEYTIEEFDGVESIHEKHRSWE